ncbi:MAG: polysaccharide deacetylase family protein, partial [bacterium]
MKRQNEFIRDLKIGFLFAAFSAVVFLFGVMAVTYDRADPAPGVSPGVPASGGALPWASAELSTGVEPSTGVPVLCYHYLRERTTPLQFLKILGALLLNLPLIDDMDLWTQTAPAFERQMAYLASEGYETVDLDDLARWRRGQAVLPRKPIVITFDDGDRSVLDIAYPILERYGFKATVFVVTSKVG